MVGTREIGLAVMATSLSLIAVFLPVAFMGGGVGHCMNSFGVSMAFAIVVSLLVAFTLTPMLSARGLRPKEIETELSSRETGFYAWLERNDLRLLDWSLAHRRVVVVGLIALVFASTVPLAVAVRRAVMPGRRCALTLADS